MSKLVTQTELLEIVPELRAMAAVETAEKVREALNRLAERYVAMSRGDRPNIPATQAAVPPH
jgi:hypothetical protein